MSHTIKNFHARTLVITALLAVLAAPSSAFAADPKIDLDVVSSGGGAKLQFLNSACPSDPGYAGCVDVAKGSKNWINWELNSAATQAGWVLSAVQLDLNSLPSNIRDCAIHDFNLNPNTGYANDFRVQGNGKTGKLRDENDCETAYEINYLIFAENRETGEQANSDPVIRNGGRN